MRRYVCRALATFIAVSFVLSAIAAQPQQVGDPKKEPQPDPKMANPVPKEKWDFTLLEKNYPLKVKSVSFSTTPPPRMDEFVQFKITVEYLENDDDGAKLKVPQTGTLNERFYFFDEEGVVLGIYSVSGPEGVMTRVKGDAFRYILPVPKTAVSKIKRVQMREK